MTQAEARVFWTVIIILAPIAILLGLVTAEWGFIPTA